MSRVLLTLNGVVADSFVTVGPEDALPDESANVIVPLVRFLADEQALKARAGRLGVALEPADDAYALEGRLQGVALVTIAFPSYQDGRGYTHARHVREQLSFVGEVRAVGDVRTDHLFNLRRCGFDSFLLREDEEVARANKALARFSVAAQPAAWDP